MPPNWPPCWPTKLVSEPAGRRLRPRPGTFPGPGGASGAVLKATDLSRHRSGQVVLGGVSLTLGPGERMGVVGPNGIGKTTLLRILAGLEAPDSGRVEVSPPSAAVGYLAQSRQGTRGETVEQYLRNSCGVAEAEEAMGSALAAVAAGDMSPAAQEGYDRALARFNQVDPGGSANAPRPGSPPWEQGPACSGRPWRPCPGANWLGPDWPRLLCHALTSTCWTSRPTTSTSPVSRCWSSSCLL